MNRKYYYIYILTNQNNNVLCIGVTNDLLSKLKYHQEAKFFGFTKKYHIHFRMHKNIYV